MTMVGEEKKSGSTRISNVIEAGVEPGDDEPIGSLIKLKKVRKAKRVKDVDCSRGKGNKVEVRAQKLVVEDEKLGGMDDTLASLRKKLKGPKKDCVSLAAIDGISSWSTPEQAGQLCNELVKDGTADVKSMLKVEKKGHVMADDGYDATGDKSSENKPVGKSKRSRCTSMPKTIKVDLETADGQSFRELVDGSAIKEKAYNCFSNLTNEIVKDSLSSFVKSQAALIKKSRSSRSSKKKRGLEATGNESIPSSKDDLDSFRPMAVRRPRPGSGSSLACSNEVCESSSCPVSRTAADFAHDQAKVLDYQKPDDGFSEPFTCRQEYMSSGGLDQGLSSSTSSLVALLKKRKYGDNVSRGQVNGSQVCTIDACASNKDMEEIIESTIDLNSAAVNQNALENKNSENGFSHCSVGRESDLKYNDASISNSISFSVPKQRNEICFANMSVLTDASDQPLEPCPGNDMLRNSCGSPLKQLCKKLCERTVELSSKPPCQSTYPPEGQMDGGFNFEGENDSSIGNGRKEKACSCYGHNQTHSICTIEPNGYVRSDEAGILSNPSSLGLPLNEYVTSTECGRLASEQNQPYYYVSTEKFLPTQDNICVSEEAIGVYSPSPTPDENETYPEDAVLMHDSANNDLKFSTVQRAVRKSKKIRLEDMAYEGDADWEILTHERSLLQEYQDPDGDSSYKMKEKLDSISSTVTEAENSGAAAVSVGMKAHAVGPIEKIKFKDVLKRKGGLQEYLECRNKILHIWSKDVTRILPLAECGVTDTPFEDEPPRASLIRKIYTFLDQNGYINVGIASEKEKSGPKANPSYTLVEDKYLVEHSGLSTADTEDGVSFILGRVKSSNASMSEKNDVLIDVANQLSEATNDTKVVTRVSKSLCQTDHSNWSANNIQPNDEAKPFSELVDGENLPLASNNVILDGGKVPASSPSLIKESCSIQTVTNHKDEHQKLCNSGKRVIVIGAGPAGLTAARHLQRQGFSVVILEARGRIGGRVYTDRSSLSVPVDLGASIITGVEADVATERRPDPSSLVCAQLGLELTVLNSDCPLYDIVSGQKVPAQLDEALETEFNSLLDDMILLVAQKGEHAMRMSLEDGLEYALKRCRLDRSSRKECEVTRLSDVPFSVSEKINFDNSSLEKNGLDEEVLCPLERRVMDWHFANLEYGCAALLKEVSLPYWNQDDAYGGFGGAHCMIKGGYSTVLESLAKGLAIHLNHVVAGISYSSEDSNLPDNQSGRVEVFTSSGSKFSGDAVLITVPLGCLKAEAISFSPSLPQWKLSSIQRLGFGVLNKVVLEFPHVFWDDSVDYFGATAEKTSQRGQCFMFWNVRKTVGAPVLIALVVGKAALVGQNLSADDHVKHAVTVLRTLFGESSVPDPVASIVTDWGRDPFSFGAYSYVAIGASGEDYDILGRPVDNCLFFAGEATCKEHPDTVGGAMMSGIREAVRIIDILSTGNDYTAEVEAMEAAQRHSDSERNEVRDITKRLEAIELSNVLYKNSVDRAHILTREALLCDMFFNAKTTAGRLHLAKELLSLPVESLKSFAGTKYGLAVLNSWMLDSMGKDGTQLLRHCVRILVLVSTNLLAVRLSGIGKTVKEKVCVHTSRDIRAIASQLVSVWIEVFRKEKVSNGGLKLPRQATALDCSKSKSTKGLASGKPPLRQHSNAPDDRRDLQASASAGRHCLSNTLHHKVNSQSIKLHRANESKSDINFSKSESSIARVEVQEEDNFAMSEEEQAAIAAAEAARAAALAAAQAYASESKSNALLPLPKIPSFHKFARREQYAHMDESDARKKWSGGVLGRQDCISEIDSRNCRVRDWSVDFAAAGVNFDSSRVSMDNLSHRSHSCEIASHTNLREHSGESVAGDSSVFTKAWVDSAGSVGLKDYHAIERWQSQPAADGSDVLDRTVEMKDEEDSCNVSEKLHDKFVNDSSFSLQQNESSVSQVTLIKQPVDNQPRGSEHIKQAVMDYVASLLMPLYKARKIDREGYKVIMKRTATKVIEATTDAEKAMNVSEFLDFKRRNKIRAFVDKLIEKQMAVKPDGKS